MGMTYIPLFLGWELLGYRFGVTEQDLDRQSMGSDVCHLGKGLRQWISGE